MGSHGIGSKKLSAKVKNDRHVVFPWIDACPEQDLSRNAGLGRESVSGARKGECSAQGTF